MDTRERQTSAAAAPTHAGGARPPRALTGVAAGLAVVILLAVGVLVWGRVAPTEMIAMALTGLWFLAVLVGAAVIARRRRHLAVPLAVGYGLSAVAAVVLLGLPQLRDRTVDEQVATVDAPATPADAAAADAPAGAPAADGNTAAASGTFVDLVHPGSGTASVVELADGGRVLTLTGFETDPGPDLRVYLTAQDPAAADGEIGEFVDLGALKGNVGDQQYEIPADADVDALSNAVIWCRAFSVGFTSAALNAT
ncbi:hypothetical protein BH23ACT10_BH23ACT10_02830 [soil metagenome]